jgi:hexosaminidase
VTAEPALIPWPSQLTTTGDEHVLHERTRIVAAPEVEPVAELLREDLARATGFALPPGGPVSSSAIELGVVPARGPEAYRLEVGGSRIRVVGGDAAGVFYGTQTLKQLMPIEIFGALDRGRRWVVPGVEIEDRPALGWRGSLLDVARHFMPKEFVLRFVDLLALHKLNVLHLHLTDDQGWRIEIRRYPRLTEVGAWRAQTLVGRPNRDQPELNVYDGVPHGGFYTQDDVREIVDYAARRFVRVMPEIELPGHSRAAIASYPELGDDGRPVEVGSAWGIETGVLNVEAATVDFFEHVFEEVFELFPSEFVHVGGDECPKDEWRASARAQQLMRERGLMNSEELQSWFIRQFDAFFAEHDRRLVGWDEILEGGLAPGAIVMSWRGEEGGVEAAEAGHDVVMTPRWFTYLDYRQSDDDHEPLAQPHVLPLERAYAYLPVPAGLSAAAARRVLGSQFAVWTEYISTPRHVEYMAFPRACAFAEVAWSAQRQPYEAFLARLRTHLRRLSALGVAYRPLEGPSRPDS